MENITLLSFDETRYMPVGNYSIEEGLCSAALLQVTSGNVRKKHIGKSVFYFLRYKIDGG